MQWWQRQGLRFKLALGVNLLVMAILGGVFFGISRYTRAQLWQREIQAAEDLSAVAVTLLQDAMMVGRKDRIEEALVDLGESVGGQIDAIAVYDDQAMLTSFASGFPGGRAIQQESLEVDVKALKEQPTMSVVSLEGEEVLRSIVPIPNEPRCQTCHGTGAAVLGDTIVHLRLDRFRQARTVVSFGLAGGAILIVVLVAIALYLLLHRIVLSPLEELRAVTQEVIQGGVGRRARVRSGDEVGQVATAFNDMTVRLGELIGSLEQRVAGATRNLEAAAEVSRATTSVLDPDALQRQVVDMIRERFGLYYVGLFLLDEYGEYAVLRAGTGEFGRVMLLQGHRLAVGGESMIGQCVARNKQVVFQAVGDAVVRFENPLLPDTQSELALPMRARGRVIGAMTVQSDQVSVFDAQYVSTLQTLADQVAVAVDNARLFQQTQERADAERRAYGELTREAWGALLRAQPDLGYVSDAHGIAPVEGLWEPQMETALQTGEIALGEVEAVTLSIPIRVRGQVVGVVDGRKPDGTLWTPEEIDLLEAMAEQLNVALEGAQLYRDAQRREARERTIGQVAGSIRQSLELESMLRTAASEIRQAMGLDKIVVRLATPETVAIEPGTQDEKGNDNVG